jgi:hypothetical protein
MTVISTSVQCPRPSAGARVRPSGVSRLALVVGLALVAWGRRASNQPAPTHEEVYIRRIVEREAEQTRSAGRAWGHPYSTNR